MNEKSDARAWKEVLEFWFPEQSTSNHDADIHRECWMSLRTDPAAIKIVTEN